MSLRLALLGAAAATTAAAPSAAATTAAASPIRAQRLSAIVKVLASDEFQGRAPGIPGEVKTVAYLIQQFRSLGLQPAGERGGRVDAAAGGRRGLESEHDPQGGHFPGERSGFRGSGR